MKIIPFTEARLKLTPIINELVETGEPVCITRFGKPVAVLLPYKLYNTLARNLQDANSISDCNLQTS